MADVHCLDPGAAGRRYLKIVNWEPPCVSGHSWPLLSSPFTSCELIAFHFCCVLLVCSTNSSGIWGSASSSLSPWTCIASMASMGDLPPGHVCKVLPTTRLLEIPLSGSGLGVAVLLLRLHDGRHWLFQRRQLQVRRHFFRRLAWSTHTLSPSLFYLVTGLRRRARLKAASQTLEDWALARLGLASSAMSASQSVGSIGFELTKSNCTLFLFIILYCNAIQARAYIVRLYILNTREHRFFNCDLNDGIINFRNRCRGSL